MKRFTTAMLLGACAALAACSATGSGDGAMRVPTGSSGSMSSGSTGTPGANPTSGTTGGTAGIVGGAEGERR